jgi:hypothetical protein
MRRCGRPPSPSTRTSWPRYWLQRPSCARAVSHRG